MKILLVEDEIGIAKPLIRTLEKAGYVVDYAETGDKAWELASVNMYNCILLDLNLPGLDGIQIAEKLREANDTTPILMLTARSAIDDKLDGFEVGADDYVTKPFNLKELLARVEALIKRSSLNQAEKLEFHSSELIPRQNKVISVSGKETYLSNKETALLELLIRNKGNVVTTEEILEQVWDSEIDLFTDTVRTHIKTLRKKVDPNKELIQTIRGKGYLLQRG